MYLSVLLFLIWSARKIHCSFPYVSFMGQTLANHSYVDLSLVGDEKNGSDSVQCHTDLSTCCSGAQGPHRGDWYFPDGTRLQFSGQGGIYEYRGDKRVDLRHSGGIMPYGIYRCNIPTIGVHHDTDTSARDTVYVGLYTSSGGMILLADNLTQTFDFDGASPQYTLTCISSGGPATTVTWTRDSVILTGDDNNSVLENLTSATYIHTLTVTGRRGGCYTCTVANNISSTSTTGFYIPDNISITSFPSPPIVAGSFITLNCYATLPIGVNSTPVFQWVGPNGVMNTPADSTSYERIFKSTVTFGEIKTSQAGMYICNATLDGYLSTFLEVVVQIPVPTPVVIDSGSLLAGESLVLTCSLTLDSSVDVTLHQIFTWEVNRSDIDNNTSGRISTNGNSLTFSPVNTSDTGIYTCTLSIIISSNTPHVTAQTPQKSLEKAIIVKIPPPNVTVSSSYPPPYYVGSGVNFSCAVTLHPSVDNNEFVSVEWSGLDHISGFRYSLIYPEISASIILTISPLADQDDGTLTCTGIVTGGTSNQSASNSVDVTIIVKPIPTSKSSFSSTLVVVVVVVAVVIIVVIVCLTIIVRSRGKTQSITIKNIKQQAPAKASDYAESEGVIAANTNMAYGMITVGGAETAHHKYEIVGKPPESAPAINDGDENQYEVPSLHQVLSIFS